MWNKLRDAVAGIAEQSGIEVPGLESATTVVTDLASSAGEGVSGVVADLAGFDVVGSVTDAVGSAPLTDIVGGSADAVAGAGEALIGVVDEASADATGVVDGVVGDLAP
jgi:hypothetical protein